MAEEKDPLDWVRRLPFLRLRFAAYVILTLLAVFQAAVREVRRRPGLRRALYVVSACMFIWAVAALVAGELARREHVALDARADVIRALAAGVSAPDPGVAVAPLADACANRLTTGPPTTLLVAGAGAERGGDEPGAAGQLAGSRGWSPMFEASRARRHDNALEAWPRMMFEGPFLLPEAVARVKRSRADLFSARYLAVIHLTDPLPPELVVSVLDLSEADTVRCVGTVPNPGGDTEEVLTAPLRALCTIGGAELCEALAKDAEMRAALRAYTQGR